MPGWAWDWAKVRFGKGETGFSPFGMKPWEVGRVLRIIPWFRSATWKIAQPRGTCSHLRTVSGFAKMKKRGETDLWQLLTKKSGSNVPRSISTCPTPWAPSMQLMTPSSLHFCVKRSNGILTPGILTTVSKTAIFTFPPLFSTSLTFFSNSSSSQSSSTGNVYPILTLSAGVVSVMSDTVFSQAP